MFCLNKNLAKDFIDRLKSGEIDPVKLGNMTSDQRNGYFKSFLGEENAHQVNSLFESKLLLKNQQKGMVTWAKTVAGLKPQVRVNLIEKISKLDKVLNPSEEKAFLKDLAQTKIGSAVTLQEAQKLTELSSKVQEAKSILQKDINNSRLQQRYGERIFDIQKYIDEINPNKRNVVANVLGTPRSLVASLDFVSAPFRHGFFSLSNPAWIKNFVKIPGLLASEKSFRAQMGKIYGSKYYDTAIKGGLKIFKTGGDISKQEEQFASNILNKFPITRGSKRAYTGFLNGLRMDQMVSLLKAAELRGQDISLGSKYVKDFATTINNLTGAGSLGRFESATPTINLGIFSARMQVARFNMLNPLTYLNPKTSGEARLYALKNLIGSAAIAATAIGLARMSGAQVGTNPNKSDFGEIHVGNLTIDTTGGNRVMITLLSRLISGKYVSASDKITEIGKGTYKPLTRMDLVNSFLVGKLAPGAATVLADILTQVNGKNPYGQPVTFTEELKKQFLPLNITNGMEIFNNDPSNTALGVVLGLFGLPVEAHPSAAKASAVDWTTSQSKTLTQFQSKVSGTTFQAANQKFNSKYADWLKTTKASQTYKNLSQSDQATVLSQGKITIEKQVLKSYGFTYRRDKSNVKKSLKPK